MPLRKKKSESEHVVLDLTPGCQEALLKLEDDTATLVEMLAELIATQRAVMATLRAEIDVPVTESDGEDGVQVFADAPPKAFPVMSGERRETNTRESPFGRAPRKVQVEWLREVLADGMWHSSFTIAERYAVDERHRRYMRGAVGGRLREMYEDGEVERRDARAGRAMHEYRLKVTT